TTAIFHDNSWGEARESFSAPTLQNYQNLRMPGGMGALGSGEGLLGGLFNNNGGLNNNYNNNYNNQPKATPTPRLHPRPTETPTPSLHPRPTESPSPSVEETPAETPVETPEPMPSEYTEENDDESGGQIPAPDVAPVAADPAIDQTDSAEPGYGDGSVRPPVQTLPADDYSPLPSSTPAPGNQAPSAPAYWPVPTVTPKPAATVTLSPRETPNRPDYWPVPRVTPRPTAAHEAQPRQTNGVTDYYPVPRTSPRPGNYSALAPRDAVNNPPRNNLSGGKPRDLAQNLAGPGPAIKKPEYGQAGNPEPQSTLSTKRPLPVEVKRMCSKLRAQGETNLPAVCKKLPRSGGTATNGRLSGRRVHLADELDRF
ncbi:MAG TPA: hypothetical protein PLP17_01135, partial [Oligoflexia bacterium]|nr:hypothetical protein [Oligoflexia bacterium]